MLSGYLRKGRVPGRGFRSRFIPFPSLSDGEFQTIAVCTSKNSAVVGTLARKASHHELHDEALKYSRSGSCR